MSKRTKKITLILMLAGIIYGIVGKPLVSRAFSQSYPATTVYVEYKDQRGNDFPVPIGMEGVYVTAFGTTTNSVSPLSITKNGSQNIFALEIPAFSGTVGSGQRYQGYVSRLKINTALPFVKSFTTVPDDSLLPTINKVTNYKEVQGSSPWTGSISANQPLNKQGDSTFDFSPVLGINIGGYQANCFGRIMDKDMTWTMQEIFNVYGLNGDTIRFYATFFKVKEIFEDQMGASIPAPPSYVNGNLVDITSQPFSYQMVNDSVLPKTYVDGTFFYTYKGWYKGSGNAGSINTTYPPSINFNVTMNESADEVHIVYEKSNARVVKEEYIDLSSNMIEPAWNTTQQVKDGTMFAQVPASNKTDTSGTDWEYYGWKYSYEPMSSLHPTSIPIQTTINANRTFQYVYKKTEHTITEKWVDQADGTTLVPMVGNPKTSSVDDNDPFNGSAAATITDTGGGIWDYVGWENVTDALGTINPAATYTINSIKGGKEIRYHYRSRNTTATLDLNPTPQVAASGGAVSWSSRLTNTGTSTLNNLKLKATGKWASGLSHPTQVTVTPASGAAQNFTVSPGNWTSGFNLTGISIPSAGPNNYADITFTDTATGAVNQVLPAEIEIDGNMASPLTAENFVRIDDPDEPNLEPLGTAGLINIPDFRFGDLEVKPYAQTKGLDSASYQSSYNPYIRFKDQESLSGWSLTAKLSQFTSGSKTLPATTTIQLKNGDLKEVQNYNKDNESLSSISSIGTKLVPSDGTSVALTSGAAQGVYQLDYAFNDVELDLMAHSGIAGLSYQADMEWTLTTAP